MTVYVTQETNANFAKAEPWGQVEFLTNEDLNNNINGIHNHEVIMDIKHKLKKFDQEHDWIVIAGSPYISAAVFMLLGKKYGWVKVLRWDNRDQTYIPMQIQLP